MTTELIKITTNENNEQLVSARDLYKELKIKKRFSEWWEVNSKNFVEYVDYTPYFEVHPQNKQQIQNYAMLLDMAKHLALQSQSKKGYEVRQYFIAAEKKWNSPEMIVQRALQIQTKKVEQLKLENAELKPKALFADSVSASHTSI
ncbi:antA/AntB antirepressor family protein, partial [Melissococcus plutonius]